MPALGPREAVLAARLAWPPRRDEWIAGRAVAKAALLEAFALASWRVEILPAASGAPEVHVDGARRADLHVSITHTRHCAVAAVSLAPVGVDACDDDDGPRLPRMAKRVFDDGEAEACDAHASAETQAAVWALKEAGLKLHGGGIFMPGLRSVRVESLEPARVADPSMRVALYRLPHAAVAVASMHAGRASADDSRTDPAGSGRVTRRRPGMGSVGFGWTLLSTRIVRERPG
jgi:phosphopantetheinyl transferase (holo-ACP synthase)